METVKKEINDLDYLDKLSQQLSKSEKKVMIENSWEEWSKFTLKELERLNMNIEHITKSLNEIKIEVKILKVKHSVIAGFWGAMGGAIIAITTILLKVVGSD